jgi:hypothetical protein
LAKKKKKLVCVDEGPTAMARTKSQKQSQAGAAFSRDTGVVAAVTTHLLERDNIDLLLTATTKLTSANPKTPSEVHFFVPFSEMYTVVPGNSCWCAVQSNSGVSETVHGETYDVIHDSPGPLGLRLFHSPENYIYVRDIKPMWEGKVEPGDWLLSVNGTPLGAAKQLAQVLAEAPTPRSLRLFREKVSPKLKPPPAPIDTNQILRQPQRARLRTQKNSTMNPRTAYSLFFQDMRRVVTGNPQEARLRIGQAWSELTHDVKKHYFGRAAVENQQCQPELQSPRSSMPTAQASYQHGAQHGAQGSPVVDKSPCMTMFEKIRKHPDAPKKVVEAYLFFSQVMRPKLLAGHPQMKAMDGETAYTMCDLLLVHTLTHILTPSFDTLSHISHFLVRSA